MSYADRIKSKIKDADLERQLSGLIDEGEKVVKETVTKAGDLAHDKRDEVEVWLDKASVKVNEKTDGKYVDRVTQVHAFVLAGLDKLAEQGSKVDQDPSPTPPPTPDALRPAPDAEPDGPTTAN